MIVIKGGVRRLAVVPPINGPAKPRAGAECNGCGVCCVAEPCLIAIELMPDIPLNQPCRFLEWESGRSWCGLMRLPLVGPWVRSVLGNGTCDSGPDEGPDAFEGLTARGYLGATR